MHNFTAQGVKPPHVTIAILWVSFHAQDALFLILLSANDAEKAEDSQVLRSLPPTQKTRVRVPGSYLQPASVQAFVTIWWVNHSIEDQSHSLPPNHSFSSLSITLLLKYIIFFLNWMGKLWISVSKFIYYI